MVAMMNEWSQQRKKRATDYQQLRLRCPQCGRLNVATEIACRYCGADLFKAEIIRGTDYERFDANDLRISCLLAVMPGLGMLREGKCVTGLLMLLFATFLAALLWAGWRNYDLPLLPLLLLPLLSAVSVFATFLAALDRMGMPRPEGRDFWILLGRLLGGYALIAIAVLFCWVLPVSVVALWLSWRLLQPFFGKAIEP
jgi:DNA-directed RNA polymerase subunit RPC12/RpoP